MACYTDRIRLTALLAAILTLQLPTGARAAHTAASPVHVSILWLLVLPQQPTTVYVGIGTPDLEDSLAVNEEGGVDLGYGCSDLAMKSIDGGNTWGGLGANFARAIRTVSQCDTLPPFTVSPDGQRTYAFVSTSSASSDL